MLRSHWTHEMRGDWLDSAVTKHQICCQSTSSVDCADVSLVLLCSADGQCSRSPARLCLTCPVTRAVDILLLFLAVIIMESGNENVPKYSSAYLWSLESFYQAIRAQVFGRIVSLCSQHPFECDFTGLCLARKAAGVVQQVGLV